MIVAPPSDLWLMLLAMVLASVAGCALAGAGPWSAAARQARIPFAAGLAAGPFILGLATVLALALLPGASHRAHLVAAGLIVTGVAAPAWWLRPTVSAVTGAIWTKWERILAVALAVCSVLLFFNALCLPLSQNDSLEYALVGRLLYEVRDLGAYPAIDLAAGSSGFFAPWTHPPLYVALIYLGNVLQGHAETPGLMRLIAPWCALAATALVLSLGNLINRLTGLFAALVFVSTPLFFLGADSALIDALPVLGMTLVLAVVIAMEGSPLRQGIALGLALGFALWTHSQAVLFLPLAGAAVLGRAGPWRNWPGTIPLLGATGVTAAAIACWPYLKNFKLFGSPISDNPAVFALPALEWTDYFDLARGIDTWAAKIQYGLLKGWFAPEAYGAVFWLALLPVIFWRQLGPDRTDSGDRSRLLRVVLASAGCYLAGVAASLAIGTNLMIKNERYWLVLLPGCALLAGSALARLLRPAGPVAPWRSRLSALALAAVLAGLALELAVFCFYRLNANGVFEKTGRTAPEDLLRHRPAYAIIDFLRRETPPDALVLAIKPADMYYAKRRMVSYLDPRLLPFYESQEPVRAVQLLRDIGISYIQVPDYSIPPVYNSVLLEILARPDLTRLAHQADGNQIYALQGDGRIAATGPVIDLTPGQIPWMQEDQLLIGGRKALGRYAGQPRPHIPAAPTPPASTLFQRDWSTLLLSGDVPVRLDPDAEYRLELDLRGRAFVLVWLTQFDRAGRPVAGELARSASTILLAELALAHPDRNFAFKRRFRSHPEAASVRIGVEVRGGRIIEVAGARLVPITRDPQP